MRGFCADEEVIEMMAKLFFSTLPRNPVHSDECGSMIPLKPTNAPSSALDAWHTIMSNRRIAELQTNANACHK